MPRRFLSRAERQQLEQFPPDVSKNDLIVYFTLTPADKERVVQQRTPHTQLGFALLLSTLRYLGFFPTDLRTIPKPVITYVANQIDTVPDVLSEYVSRPENRREQLGSVMGHLGFRRIKQADKDELVAWLGDRALENERPSLLLQLACERLYQLRLVRPAVTTLEELVADARQRAWKRSHKVLLEPLPHDERAQLRTLLVPKEDTGIAPLTWLRRAAPGHSDKDILDTLDKLEHIRQWSVDTWNVSGLPPSRLKFLAQIARYTSNQGLQRKKPIADRDTILAAFLLWTHEKTIDELIDLFDECLAEAYRRSRRDLKAFQLTQFEHLNKIKAYFQENCCTITTECAGQGNRLSVYETEAIATRRMIRGLTMATTERTTSS